MQITHTMRSRTYPKREKRKPKVEIEENYLLNALIGINMTLQRTYLEFASLRYEVNLYGETLGSALDTLMDRVETLEIYVKKAGEV